MNRLKYIDVARGIAILCIILGHFGIWEVIRVVFTFHVPIFFFITGYFTNRKLPVKEFVINKAKTLLIPYAITCVIVVVISIIKSFLMSGNALLSAQEWIFASLYGSGDSYYEPFYIKEIGALWFLWASFWGSIFLRLALNMKKWLRVGFVLGLFAIGFYSAQELFWFPFSIQAGCCATLFMYFGYLVYEIKAFMPKISHMWKPVFTIAAIAVWIQFIINFDSFWFVQCDFGRGFIDIIGSLCASYSIIKISQFLEKRMKFIGDGFAFLGKYSLIVLCTHVVEMHVVEWDLLENLFIGSGVSVLGAKCLCGIIKLAFIVLMTVCVSKGVKHEKNRITVSSK